MSADALNLINHMKLHVNGKMVEDDDDRKKEQETKNFLRRRIYIQGTKIRIIVNSTIYRENQLSEFVSNASEENEEFLAFLL